ncbi:ribosomal large subunit pseudouridine synthase B [Clostridium tepidiprofundi DSM 19306]|uniref:Pseudouridine synthase n=2 Tax=Clostridium TaxID=1485 RepID=A0A151B768_9CLOT|nr:ribosomal large subunit pseudouridine synthase B [Clostridium tepidiprofundi DSM 19306]
MVIIVLDLLYLTIEKAGDSMSERLQKYLARCGIASRRKCEDLILQGKVKVNNSIITELGFKVNPDLDVVKFENNIVKPENNKIYIALNKPIGYISTVKDEKGRKTILDLVDIQERIYPIGRLDCDTSGLILLTNDGEIYNQIIHPRKALDKTYIAVVKGVVEYKEIKKLCNGVDIGGYITAPAKAEILSINNNNNTKLKIIIHEGKNRQVRRMCDSIGHSVINLKRVSIGKIKLDNLQLGKWRYLDDNELEYIKNI